MIAPIYRLLSRTDNFIHPFLVKVIFDILKFSDPQAVLLHPPDSSTCPPHRTSRLQSPPSSTMTTPTLPPDWTPTQAGCLSPSDFWIWDYHTDSLDNRTVLGGPSQTSNCFPPTWVSTGEYIGTQCPPQYTAACQATDSLEPVTCCPTSEPPKRTSATDQD
jgi:hypothetical protein